MTARKTTSRARRSTAGATHIPTYIAQWFAGERTISYTGATYPHRAALPDYWAAWKQEHPNAEPPENLAVFLRPPHGMEAQRAAAARRKLGLPSRKPAR